MKYKVYTKNEVYVAPFELHQYEDIYGELCEYDVNAFLVCPCLARRLCQNLLVYNADSM